MSKDLNQCNFIGRLGRDAELKSMPNGNAVCNFSIACGDDYKDKQSGQKVEQTNWINIVMFGRSAEIAGQYLRKGSKVFISGKQVTRKWQGQDGTDRYSTEIIANDMQMLDSKKDGAGSQAPQSQPRDSAQPAPQSMSDDFDDDIPF